MTFDGLSLSINNSALIGESGVQALYTSKLTTATVSNTVSIYSFATASYTSAHIDYNVSSGSNLRAGSLTAVWQGNSITYTDVSTVDLGTTTGFTFSFVISGTYAVLQALSSTSTWGVKTLIRAI